MTDFRPWPVQVLTLLLGPALLFSGCSQVSAQNRPEATVTALSGLPQPQINTLAPTQPPRTATPPRGSQAMDSGAHSPTPPPSPTAQFTAALTRDPLACLDGLTSPEYAAVQWVVSGDTIVVMLGDQRKSVRYLGIDAPSYLPDIRFIGPPALKRNRELVQDQIVTLYRDGPNTDAIGQLLRYVVVNNLFVNYELARYGLAHTTNGATGLYPDGAPDLVNEGQACRAELLDAEQTAREERIGMWTDEGVALGLATSASGLATATVGLATMASGPATATPMMGQSTSGALSTNTPNPTNTSGPTAMIGTTTPTSQLTQTITRSPTGTNTPTNSGNQPPIVLQHSPTLPVLTHTPTPSPTNGQSSGSPAPSATQALPTLTPTPTLTPSPSLTLMPTRTGTIMPTVPSIPFLSIADLVVEGDPERSEADEYVEIINEYTFDFNLTGFQVIVKTTGVTFTFPQFTLEAGETCRIYTNQIQADSCVQDSFRSQTPIWGNPDHADCAQLYDAYGQMWDQYCY